MAGWQFKMQITDIEEYLQKTKKEIDLLLAKYLPRRISFSWIKKFFGQGKFKLSTIQRALIDPIWEFFDRGGKRWRPALFLLILESFGGDKEKLKDFSLIPEIAHTGSLIVDDIEDEGELRRGKPCLHKIFGIDLALNVGNFLYFFPIFIFQENKKKISLQTYNRCLETYFTEMKNLHLGQGIDIFWHQGKMVKISEKEYLQMTAIKTGCLAGMTAEMAVILAKREKLAEKMKKFGQSLGIAFQIQDDILDITLSGQKRKEFGKSFGNDIKEGKRTLMVIYTLNKAKKEEKERLLQILNKHTENKEEQKEAIKIIQKYGGIEYAKKKAEKILIDNWQKIEKEIPNNQAKNLLKELVFYLISRKK